MKYTENLQQIKQCILTNNEKFYLIEDSSGPSEVHSTSVDSAIVLLDVVYLKEGQIANHVEERPSSDGIVHNVIGHTSLVQSRIETVQWMVGVVLVPKNQVQRIVVY